MATKTVEIQGVGMVKLVKSSRSRSVRLSIDAQGAVRVSIPVWTPYAVGQAFALDHLLWIQQELAKRPEAKRFYDGQKIGKLHHLHFEMVPGHESTGSRVTATKIVVKHRSHEQITDTAVQERAQKATYRALKKETEQLLPPRTKNLAEVHGFAYKTLSAKQLKRRWGSCDSHKNIIYNFFLMELPWKLIDYVILHELTHTEHLNHGSDFWVRLVQVCPRARDLKKQIKQYQPIIQGD